MFVTPQVSRFAKCDERLGREVLMKGSNNSGSECSNLDCDLALMFLSARIFVGTPAHLLTTPSTSSSGAMVTGPRATTRPILILIIVGSLSFLIFQSTIRQHTLATLSAPLKLHLQALSLSLGGLPDSAPAPGTQSCEVCVVDPDSPLCEYGLDNVRQSKAFEGSGYRMRKFLEKAIRGEEVRIGVSSRVARDCRGGGADCVCRFQVIGASVTRGHGLKPGQSIWYSQFFEEFQRMFPNSKIYDGSSPGVNSTS